MIKGAAFRYLEPTVEFKALQLRKIIEQIIVASLRTNSEKYLEFYRRLERDWNARIISRDIARINPGFFPKAAINNPERKTIENKEGAIGCEDLISIYEKLSKYLHSTNPFSSPIDYQKAHGFINESLDKIVNLLNCHTVELFGEDGFLFVVMNSSNHGGKVGINLFESVENPRD